MSTDANKALIRRAVEAFNSGDLDAVDTLFAPDFVDHDPSRAGLPPGPEGIKQAWGTMRAAFPDLRVTIDELIAEGDKVVARAHIDGTHRGELLGLPPTGKVVSFELIDITRIADDALAERWAVADTQRMLQQLGAIPAAAQAQAGEY